MEKVAEKERKAVISPVHAPQAASNAVSLRIVAETKACVVLCERGVGVGGKGVGSRQFEERRNVEVSNSNLKKSSSTVLCDGTWHSNSAQKMVKREERLNGRKEEGLFTLALSCYNR
jgi:hypothetical protein